MTVGFDTWLACNYAVILAIFVVFRKSKDFLCLSVVCGIVSATCYIYFLLIFPYIFLIYLSFIRNLSIYWSLSFFFSRFKIYVCQNCTINLKLGLLIPVTVRYKLKEQHLHIKRETVNFVSPHRIIKLYISYKVKILIIPL